MKPGNLLIQGAKSRQMRQKDRDALCAPFFMRMPKEGVCMNKKLFTSESVTEGHPDKLCDMVSDAVLDAFLAKDPLSRVACETFATTGVVTVMGEVTTRATVDIAAIVRETVKSIGYDKGEYGFDGNTCAVLTSLHEQSPDIALGVDRCAEDKAGSMSDGLNIGAGDQGLMFGYACRETEELMPLPISLSHSLAKQLTFVRKSGKLPFLRPDGKTQVTVEYEKDKPCRIDTVVVSSQHSPDVGIEELRDAILAEVITPVIPKYLMDDKTKIFINPTGRFVIGGPMGDTGLTGRKIIVDTYGGYSRHGGGAFSGKDPTKVDRSASYAARYLAKNVVAAGLAEKCEVQIAYAIGVAHPVSVMVETFGTGKVAEETLVAKLLELVDLRPAAIIERFGLRRPIYKKFAAYGHMGREELDCPWEKTDIAQKLSELL